MIIIASLHLYANETDSMEDSIEALHELMHFFYSKLTPIYGIVRDVQKTIFFYNDVVSRRKLGIKTKYSRPESNLPFNQPATEGQLHILMRPLMFN